MHDYGSCMCKQLFCSIEYRGGWGHCIVVGGISCSCIRGNSLKNISMCFYFGMSFLFTSNSLLTCTVHQAHSYVVPDNVMFLAETFEVRKCLTMSLPMPT